MDELRFFAVSIVHVFQSYQDDKAVCIGTPFTVEKISPRTGLELKTTRTAGQRLTH